MRRIYFWNILILSLLSKPLLAQNAASPNLFSEVNLQIDTLSFTKNKNTINSEGEKTLWFRYFRDDEVCRVKLFPWSMHRIKSLALQESGDYDIVDSAVNYNNQYYEFKVQFNNLTKSNFLKFRLLCEFDSIHKLYYDINLLPVTKTSVKLNQSTDELSVGEEKVFELLTNNTNNIKYTHDWITEKDISYRITENNGQLLLHVIASAVGKKTLKLSLQTNKPDVVNGELTYDMPDLNYNFNVKSAGLVFLQPDKNDIVLDDEAKTKGVELQIENNRFLEMNKTYIIESQENVGGPIIGTLYTRDKLSNNKVLCILRTFNYHKQSEGYLYIKDDDQSKFITNLNVIPKTTIERIKIMRNGTDWVEDETVYPGETFNLRLEGQSLNRAKFNFDGLINLATDSIIISENSAEYKLKVPLNGSKKIINIYNYSQNTGKSLTVKEYQSARPFDYINLNFGDKTKNVADFRGPELYDKPVRDVTISFLPNKIDAENKLYGKQYFDVDVKLFNARGELLDYASIEGIAICPGENSPRYSFYDKNDSYKSDISLNSKISRRIYSLKDWSKIRLTFTNTKDKYQHDLQSKTVEIVLQRNVTFDIDVSFPAGLLIKKMNTPGIGNFGGVSMAVISEFSFYNKNRIAELRPYKIGAGFIAMNLFDLSQSAQRDMGVVVIGTLTPINTNRKLTFPIYLGGGYMLSQKTWFWLIGPGISVSF